MITDMMKKVLLGMSFALMSVAGYAQGVLGKWYTEAGDAQVEIYQSGDQLKVRAYIGVFYETQTWKRKK
jgi:hypothetical protein